MVAINEKPNQDPEQKKLQEKEKYTEAAQQRKDLEDYLKQKEQPLPPDFEGKLKEWDQNGRFEIMRRSGVDEKGNRENYLTRHTRLAKTFLEEEKNGDELTFKVNFRGNKTAEATVGAGDMLPPTVLAVAIKKPDGTYASEYAVRKINPVTNRIGFYDVETGKYVAVYNDYGITVEKTTNLPLDPQTQKPLWNLQITQEHNAIYKNGADFALEQVEKDNMQKLQAERNAQQAQNGKNLPSAISDVVRANTADRIADFRNNFVVDPEKIPKINGYKVDREFCKNVFGKNAEEVKPYIVKIDPLTKKPPTFLHREIPDGVNKAMLPFLIEAESRINAAGIKYKIKVATCTCWREIRGSTQGTLSYHSWGMAIDLNPDQNAQGKSYDQLSPESRIPEELANIMKELGFVWGKDFPNPDAMHFELRTIDTSKLQSSEAKQCAALYLKDVPFDKANQPAPNNQPAQKKQSQTVPAAVKPMAIEQPKKETPKKSGESFWSINKAKYRPLLEEAEQKYNLPRGILSKIQGKESGSYEFPEKVASKAEAGGIMQIVPSVAKNFGKKLGYAVQTYPVILVRTNSRGQGEYELDPRDTRNDPVFNINVAASLVKYLCNKYGNNVENVMRAYNWGEGNTDKWLATGKGQKGQEIPEETVRYTQ